MKYTRYNLPQVDEKIENDLNIIVSEVRSILAERIRSIVLVGGFGRGEGSVVLEADGVRIINDYDIIIFLKNENVFSFLVTYKRFNGKLLQTAERLATELNIKQIDLAIRNLNYYQPENLCIETAEVVKGYKTLFGEEDVLKDTKEWSLQKLPLFDGAWLFRNRGIGLLIAARYFYNQDFIKDEKKENFIIECNKALLAIGDAVLLLKKKYHHLYRKRIEMIESVDGKDIPNFDLIKQKYISAINQKLKPDFNTYRKSQLEELWYETSALFGEFFLFFESKRLGTELSAWIDYHNLKKPENKINPRSAIAALVKNIGILKSRIEIKKAMLKINKARSVEVTALLLFAVGKEGLKEAYLLKAAEIMGETVNRKPGPKDWIKLTDAFLLRIHAAGEVLNVVESKT